MDTSSPEFQAALRDHAKSLGVDPDKEASLMSIVEQALLAELPNDWEQGETEEGTLYYFNTVTEESIWEHPLDAHYRDLIKTTKETNEKIATKPETSTVSNTKSETSTVSNIEVYSFDNDSDEEETVKPSTTKATDSSSRIASLFSQPTSSFSPPSVTTTLKSDTTTTKPTNSMGFGRDRSWLLDNDDDDITTLDSKPTVSLKTETIDTSDASKASYFNQPSSFGSRNTPSTSSTTSANSLSFQYHDVENSYFV